jgi:hypothetical protein
MNNGGTVFGGDGLEALAGKVPPLPAKASSPALFIIHYSLFIIHYSLFIIHYSLFIIHYSLFIKFSSQKQNEYENNTRNGYWQINARKLD